jgi:hypothetical protein
MDYFISVLVIIFGVLSVISAVALTIYVRRRAFYRRNGYGAETFNSYGEMAATGIFETLVCGFAIVLGLVGIFTFIVGIALFAEADKKQREENSRNPISSVIIERRR